MILFVGTASAGAVDLFPIDDLIGDGISGLGGVAGDVVEKGFGYIVETLFGGAPAKLTTGLLKWLISVPDLSGGGVARLQRTTVIMAFALLGVVMTISVLRYWISGLSSSAAGGFAGIQGVIRTVIAAGLIASWPALFGLLVEVSNALSHSILSSEAMQNNVGRVLASGVAIGALTAWTGVPLFLGIAVAIAGMLMLLALVGMKILILALTVVIALAMPLALVVWPIPELSWVARLLGGALVVVLAIPLVWGLVFGAFAALWADTLLVDNNGKDVGVRGSLANAAIVKPLVALALMYLAIVLPKRLVSMAPMLAGGFGVGALQGAAHSYLPRLGGGGGGAMGAAGASGLSGPSGPGGPRGGGGGGGRFGGGGARSGGGGGVSGGGGGARRLATPASAAAGAVGGGAAGAAIGARGGAAKPAAGALGAGAPEGAKAAAATRVAGAAALSGGSGAQQPIGAGAQQRAPRAAPAVTKNGEQGRDRFGGPREAMSPERAQKVREVAARMERVPASQRPGGKQVRQAFESLPVDLQAASKRATWDAGPEQARTALAGWASHRGSGPSSEALLTIAGGDRATWQDAIPMSDEARTEKAWTARGEAPGGIGPTQRQRSGRPPALAVARSPRPPRHQ